MRRLKDLKNAARSWRYHRQKFYEEEFIGYTTISKDNRKKRRNPPKKTAASPNQQLSDKTAPDPNIIAWVKASFKIRCTNAKGHDIWIK